MAITHAPYCDEQHQDRQRCNDALRPDAHPVPETMSSAPTRPHEAFVDTGETIAPPPITPVTSPASEAASYALREAVTAGVMPGASPRVALAWEETARAVSAITAPPPPARAWRAPLRRRLPKQLLAAAAIGAATIAFVALAIILRTPPDAADTVAALGGLPRDDGRATGNGDQGDDGDPAHVYLE